MAFAKFPENRFRIDGEIAENHAILVNLTASRSIVQMLDHLTCSKFEITTSLCKPIKLAWISNYLCDRKQRVVLQGESSCWADINAGVPQGSVLGPLLFLVYNNDMEEGLASKLTLFADDNLLLSISNCHIINLQILNSDLEKLEAWAQQWIVSFSALKTNSMVVNYRNITPPNNLKMYSQELQNMPYSKHLGVTLQQNL